MGFFGTDIAIDITEAEKHYTFVDKKKHIVICNHCEGAGKSNGRYGFLTGCNFCNGQGWIKLNITGKKK